MAYQIYSYLAKSECFCCCQLFDYGFLMNENAELLLVAISNINVYMFLKILYQLIVSSASQCSFLATYFKSNILWCDSTTCIDRDRVLVAKYDVADCHKNNIYSYSWPTSI